MVWWAVEACPAAVVAGRTGDGDRTGLVRDRTGVDWGTTGSNSVLVGGLGVRGYTGRAVSASSVTSVTSSSLSSSWATGAGSVACSPRASRQVFPANGQRIY